MNCTSAPFNLGICKTPTLLVPPLTHQQLHLHHSKGETAAGNTRSSAQAHCFLSKSAVEQDGYIHHRDLSLLHWKVTTRPKKRNVEKKKVLCLSEPCICLRPGKKRSTMWQNKSVWITYCVLNSTNQWSLTASCFGSFQESVAYTFVIVASDPTNYHVLIDRIQNWLFTFNFDFQGKLSYFFRKKKQA